MSACWTGLNWDLETGEIAAGVVGKGEAKTVIAIVSLKIREFGFEM